MKNDTMLVRLACFISGVAVGIMLSIFNYSTPQAAPSDEFVSTNAIVQVVEEAETNRASSASPQVDWFKDNSNYIWDGWKIK